MNCPPEIASIVTEIIKAGILAARASSWSNDVKRCGIETDHIHNLPDLLQDYQPHKLEYYWSVERPVYIQEGPVGIVEAYAPLWDRLEKFVELTEDRG